MEKSSKPIFQTTTDEGTTIKIDANLPNLSSLKQQTEKAAENFPPSNAQIEENLESAKETLEKGKKEGNLNERGQTLVKDVEKLIDTTATALEEKNKDDKLQKLYADTKEAVDKTAPILKKEAQKEGKKIQKKGEEIQKKGEKVGKEAKSKLKKAGKEAKSDLKEQSLELKDDAQELYSYIKNLLWNFLRSEDFRELAADWVGFLQFLGTKNLKEKAKEQKGKGGVAGNVAKAVDQGLEQTSKPADQDELQKRTEDMFQDLVNRIRSKPEYRNAFQDMFKLWDQFQAKFDAMSKEVKKEAKEVKKEVKKEAKKVKEEVKKEAKKETDKVSDEVDTDPFWKAARDAEDVVESFTGKSEWNQFKKSFKSAYNSVKDDTDLRKWISDLRSFFNAVFENPEGVTDEAYQKRAKELTTRGRQLLQKKKWRNQFNKIYENFNVLLDQIKNDTTTNEFGERLKQLGKDFALNEKGYPDLFVMEDSLIQVKNLLIPLFKQQLENINIGRIDFINDTYDVRIEDLGFSGSFLPEHIDFAMRNDSHLDTKDSSKDSMRHMLTFQVDKIKPEFKNFKFYYRRKTFPKIEDYGVADMKVSGNGGLIRVNWRVDSKGGAKPVATLTGVTVYIDRLDLHIVGEKTKHDVLDKMLVPMVTKNIKNKISSSLEDFLRSKLTEANDQLNKFLQSSPVDTIKQKANEAMQGGLEKANVQLKDFLESAPLDTLKQKASEGFEKATERMQGTMDKANEKIQSGMEKANEKFEKASDKVQEGLEKAQDTVQEGYKKAQEQKSVGAV